MPKPGWHLRLPDACQQRAKLKLKQIRFIITGYMDLAAVQLKTTLIFKLDGALNMKLNKKPARPAHKGLNPFTKEPFSFKAKAETDGCLPLEMVN